MFEFHAPFCPAPMLSGNRDNDVMFIYNELRADWLTHSDTVILLEHGVFVTARLCVCAHRSKMSTKC